MSTPGDAYDPPLPRTGAPDFHFTAAGMFGTAEQIADHVDACMDYVAQVCGGMTNSVAAVEAVAAELQKTSLGTENSDLDAAQSALSASGLHMRQAHAAALMAYERGTTYAKTLRGQR
ncbi:hypothetical protein [Phytohabitans houttuyneae]|uniref:Uncharacterized protein n=1 Tax=Phytohabitans houttuyneae TaxID=1076126 RepID=A0A6V8K4S9_9ACTN|nr:hypothetical protein [Phytohabitans houttuyneae]GFJ77401.1 hypothetical protein Phou_015810 [Phytohabitans houttuyneae]